MRTIAKAKTPLPTGIKATRVKKLDAKRTRRDELQGQVDTAREKALLQSLEVMRDSIDKFRADTGKYPATLTELVEKRYLRKLPVDPITESAETWEVVPPPDPAESGVWDVRSGARGNGRDGRPFAEW